MMMIHCTQLSSAILYDMKSFDLLLSCFMEELRRVCPMCSLLSVFCPFNTMCHVAPLLGYDRVLSKYTTAVDM
jgi:hypothetical protein